MKLPIEAQNEYLFDADGIYISSMGGSFSVSTLDAHAQQIARAVNHHDALVAALERLANQLPDCLLDWMAPAVSNSNVSAIRQARDEAHAALAAAKGEANASN